MIMEAIAEVEARYTSGAYSKRPLTIVRGEGRTLYDDAGNAYLDAASGIGVAVLGYNHPALTEAITTQAQTLITCPELFYNDRRAELYQTLASITPGDLNRFFLCNSGTEAVEGALKVARLITGRNGIVAAKRAFHGRTLGALGTTWNSHYREPFEGWTVNTITHVTYNDIASAEAAITEDTAAVLVEAVQGEGGVYPADADYLQALRRLCDEHGALLIVDEIQAGMGRTGRWFAFEHANILPDIITLGKGIAGGVPMGAVCWREIHGEIPASSHGSTFGGNPLACATAIATINALKAQGIPQYSAELGTWALETLRGLNLQAVREVRGLGLMFGLELRGRVTPVLKALQERGIIALPAGKTTLRLLPPLTITQDELQTVMNAIAEVLG